MRSTLGAQSLDRCAVVGSGHSLRCGSAWGAIIDSYDAVFRVNKVQLHTGTRTAYACNVGARVDFGINALTEDNLAELAKDPGNGGSIRRRHAEVFDELTALGAAVISKDRKGHKAAVRAALARNVSSWRAILPSDTVLHGRGLGSGSGSTAVALAMSLCQSVDAYGFGVFRDDKDAADFRYLHFYQEVPRQAGVGGGDGVTGGAQVLNSELRNAVWDAFGLVNFVWW